MIGIDIEDIARFERLLEKKPSVIRRIFTPYEWDYSATKKAPQTLAGIWCAKEAVVKAFSSVRSLDIKNVYINHYSNGAPYVFKIIDFDFITNYDVNISISHDKKNAIAICMITIKK